MRFFRQASGRDCNYFRVVQREGGEHVYKGLSNEVCRGYGEALCELELRRATCVRDQTCVTKDVGGEIIPTVYNKTSTRCSPSPLAASAQAFWTSSLINASPFISLA